MKEFYLNHFEDCEYCYRVSESIVFNQSKKDELIDNHTIDSFGNYVDFVHETYKI